MNYVISITLRNTFVDIDVHLELSIHRKNYQIHLTTIIIFFYYVNESVAECNIFMCSVRV